MWIDLLRVTPDLPVSPKIVADEALAAGECLLETQLGSVDLGVRSQLAEIERGFFDLLEQREKQGAGHREPTSQKRDPSASSGRAVGHPQGVDEQSGAGQ